MVAGLSFGCDASKVKFRANRVSAFFCLLGLVALVPSFFLPALLISDAAEGSRWFSIWSGIKLLWIDGNYFLSGLIFVFSMIFPTAKLGVVLVCCIGAHRFNPKVSHTLVKISGYTAKYSLLDVVVIALIVVLVKVDGYVRMLPTLGIYLFAVAVVASILAEIAFSKRRKNADEVIWPAHFPWKSLVVFALTLPATLIGGIRLYDSWLSEEIDAVAVERLNQRYVPRSVERLKVLKEAYDENEGWVPSRSLLGELANTVQALTTDVGEKKPELILSVAKEDGTRIEAPPWEASLEESEFDYTWKLNEPVKRGDLASVRLQSRIQFFGRLDRTITEQELAVKDDWYREATEVWFGRLFQFRLLPVDARTAVAHRWLYGTIAVVSLLVMLVALARVLVRAHPKTIPLPDVKE